MNIKFVFAIALMMGTTTAQAEPHSPELLKSRVYEELLKEGFSLKRLELDFELHGLPDGSYLIELLENKESILVRKVESLPTSTVAAVATLTVVLSEMIKKKTGVEKERKIPADATPVKDMKKLKVRIEADDPEVTLFRHLGSSYGVGYGNGKTVSVRSVHFEKVCKSPCDLSVDLSDQRDYFLGGSGVVPSRKFSLSEYKNEVTLKVEAGNAWQAYGGWVLTYLGLPTAILGGTFLAMAAARDGDSALSKPQAWMFGLLGGGLAATIPGIILWLTSGTDYQIQETAL